MARRCGPKCSARSGAALSSSTGLRTSSQGTCCSFKLFNSVFKLRAETKLPLMLLVVVWLTLLLSKQILPRLGDMSQAESPPTSCWLSYMSQSESSPTSCWLGFDYNATLGYPGEGPPSLCSAAVDQARSRPSCSLPSSIALAFASYTTGLFEPAAFDAKAVLPTQSSVATRWPAAFDGKAVLPTQSSVATRWPAPRRKKESKRKIEPEEREEREERDPLAKRGRPSNKVRAQHLVNRDTVNAALLGEQRTVDGTCTEHKVCQNPLPNGAPCFSNIWSSKEVFETHLKRFLGYSQEIRSSIVFSLLQDQFHCDSGPDGKPISTPRWHYVVSGDHGLRSVCQHVFLLAYPVGVTTLKRLRLRIESGCTCAHAKLEEGGTVRYEGKATMRDDIIGWYISYAAQIGDYMPDGQEIIVPRRWRAEEFAELLHSFGQDGPTYEYFCKVVKRAPELAHICRARKLLNFQHCTICVDHNEAVKAAMQTRDPEKVKQAKARRREHHMMTRAERLAYYARRELGRASEEALSLILDKWDSAKTTVPYFARSPGHWWSSLKHDVLEQHVLGVRVHDQPNRHYFFSVNSTVSGSANLNVEGIRRVLCDLYRSKPLPRTIYVQGDNASDNKCWTLLLFFAMLVHHGYTNDVYFSFLIVGHTHEDIDQVFSILSRFLKGIGRVVDPVQFDADLKAAMGDRPAHFENMWSVFDWINFLKPSLRTPTPVGIQHAKVGNETLVPHTFWIHKRSRDGCVVLHYKELSADAVWLPPLVPNASPLLTDPDGIEFLNPDVPPPDPLVCTPCELEFVHE